ncbi:MAG: vWA domain-containing protein [Thermodesulfobacteriota bacterium]
MFVKFFYKLREMGIPVTLTSFLRLQKALSLGLINSLEDFYTSARAILIKSERYFDLYDQVFAHYFQGTEISDLEGIELDEAAQLLLEEWLRDPEGVARALGVNSEDLAQLSPQELIAYFLERLREQTEAHHGGSKWIGTRGTSPVGHSGFHPGGMRIGGRAQGQSAVKVALDRRYRDYSQERPLTASQIGEALKRLRNLIPVGPKDQVNVEKTIYETMRNAGEIEIIFDRSLKDKLKVILMIDNGGWSMDPFVEVVQVLFDYARAQFKDLKTYYFHNTIYDYVWEDPPRRRKPQRVEDFSRFDPETRLLIVGDASMAPYELMATDGSIHIEERSFIPSIDRLRFLAKIFRHAAWLNPRSELEWVYVPTIQTIRSIFPMFELTLDGLEKAVRYLMKKN